MMNANTGHVISAKDHLKQSICDILTTPLGSRVMRPDYGSNLPRLIDAPSNNQTLVEIYAAVAGALRKWEPRYKLTRLKVASHGKGQTIIDLEGMYLVDGKPLMLEGLIV
ncbi:GPW/gp25 family protein [Pseudoalteromonas caenipelagi]|nr:GPW/gp25 family protein [Pseudoalteromonas caenipelagi]